MPYFIIEKNCTGCSACSRQCPVEAIKGVFRENYSIDPEICIECGLCGMICPEDAVLDPNGDTCKRISRKERPRPSVDIDICNACEFCVGICPAECRGITGERTYQGISLLRIPGLCTSCGECERICIKEALKLKP